MSATPPTLDDALAQALRLARAGDAEATRRCLADIRARHDIAAQPAAAVGAMLAEGVAALYAGDLVAANDRLRRALALAGTAADPARVALCHAWLALCHFNADRREQAIDEAAAALRVGAPARGQASARAANVLGVVHQLCGADAPAQGWFEHARAQALLDADALMVSAVLYNMAVYRLSACRFAAICDGAAVSDERLPLIFLESSAHYDRAHGFDVQGFLHERAQGMARALLGDPAGALALLERHVCERTPQDQQTDAFVLAERAWCRLQLGDRSGAARDAAAATAALVRLVEVDDVAVAHRRLGDVFGALDSGDVAQRHWAQSEAAADLFRARRETLRAYLDRLDLQPPADPMGSDTDRRP